MTLDQYPARATLAINAPEMLAALRELVEAFPPTLHRNGRQVAALGEARDLCAALAWIELPLEPDAPA